MRIWAKIFVLVAAGLCLVGSLWAAQPAEWTQPFPPFKIAGNLYYVGSRDLASYLVVTAAGDVLINTSTVENVPLIKKSVEKLGFKFTDIKIILVSHAHYDHCAGSAAIKRMTGAKYMVMDADVPVVESGGRLDFRYGGEREMLYPATKVDRVLQDGDEVRIGDAVLVAHLTPGHTKGCTTWTLKVKDKGRVYDVVIVGSTSMNSGYVAAASRAYPEMAADFARMFVVLKTLPCDIFLGAHGGYFGLVEKYARLKAGDGNAFLNGAEYLPYVEAREADFERELGKQRGALQRVK